MKCAYSQTIEIEELTPIEALDELYDTSTCACANEKYNIVKNALKENKNLKNSLEISLSESQKLRKENYNYQKVIELIKDLIDIDFEDGSDTDLIIGMRHYVRIPKEIENDIKEVFGNERV